MAYGTTLDSLNDAILREGMAKGQREDSFRNYLLGLAGERNRGRQVDVNAMDAGTRREGLGVTERLGNRQWDTEGRRVDVLGRDVDMREKIGMGQLDVQRGDIASRERIAGQQASINQKIAETDALYKAGLITDMERARRNQELGITSDWDIKNKQLDITSDEIGKRYGHLGRQLDLGEVAEQNRFALGLGGLSVNMADAETRARQVGNQYDVQIRQLQQNGDIEGARIKQAEKALAVQRELGIGALNNDAGRVEATKKIADAQVESILNPRPSEAMSLEVANRNAASNDALLRAPLVADLLNKKIDATGWTTWSENEESIAEDALSPVYGPSMRYLIFDKATKRYVVDPAARATVIDLMPQRRTQPAARPSAQDPFDAFFPQPAAGAQARVPQPAPAPVDRRIQLPAGSSLPISPTAPLSPMSWLLNPLTSAAASAMAPRPPGRQIVRLDANGNPY